MVFIRVKAEEAGRNEEQQVRTHLSTPLQSHLEAVSRANELLGSAASRDYSSDGLPFLIKCPSGFHRIKDQPVGTQFLAG